MYEDGPMSTALADVPLGGGVEVTLAEGDYCPAVSIGMQVNGDPVTDVALLAAGTGITPMVSVLLDAIAANRS